MTALDPFDTMRQVARDWAESATANDEERGIHIKPAADQQFVLADILTMVDDAQREYEQTTAMVQAIDRVAQKRKLARAGRSDGTNDELPDDLCPFCQQLEPCPKHNAAAPPDDTNVRALPDDQWHVYRSCRVCGKLPIPCAQCEHHNGDYVAPEITTAQLAERVIGLAEQVLSLAKAVEQLTDALNQHRHTPGGPAYVPVPPKDGAPW